jgi:hypothetical protein
MTHPTPLEVLSYLTDPVFASVIVVLLGGFLVFEAINCIGGRP